MTTTLVTSLYNIGRDNLKGKWAYRPFTKYLNWFKHTLWINAPIVIFIPEELHSYVLEHRPPEYSTHIIIRKFEELAAYKYHDRIQDTINKMVQEHNPDGRIPEYFAESPEFITAKYETIIFSKFDFLLETANNNPFQTEYFIWLDAGTFYTDPPFNYKLEWPDRYKIRTIDDKFLISNLRFNTEDKSPLSDKRSYLRLNKNDICAYILGGTKPAIERVYAQFWNEVNNALDMGVINNEQHFLQLMALEHPEYYYLWYKSGIDSQYPSMTHPIKERMIPHELSVGTFMHEKYRVNHNIKSLTIATKEISESAYQKWKDTAEYYGYDYEVLGRDEKWTGFHVKFHLYNEALKNVTAPYVLLTDSTDVFFCGSSDELYDKLTTGDKDLVTGGEMFFYAPGSKHTDKLYDNYYSKTLDDYFISIKESPQYLPNSGFLVGKTPLMLKLTELGIDYINDQGAVYDVIYDGTLPMVIDYKPDLIGNITNHCIQSEKDRSLNYFQFDQTAKRFQSKLHGTYPVALHFPGKNFQVMNDLYYISQTELAFLHSPACDNNAGWIFLGILILYVIFIAVVYWVSHSY